MAKERTGAELVVKCLEAHGVTHIFGIPGAKIDGVFNALVDSTIQLIVCRHEQNAAFMAAAVGRRTGKPGVVLVTSGPGVSNLTTGLLTATTEGDPVVALGGNVPRNMLLKESHQSTQNATLMAPVTKKSSEIAAVENIPEAIANAFRVATAPRRGATFISFPADILAEKTTVDVIQPRRERCGQASVSSIARCAAAIDGAKFPVLMLGQEASRPKNAKAIIELLKKTKLPTVGTFQAAGVVPRELVGTFAGRVGLFANQPGDHLLNQADVVVTVGFNPAEYDPEVWNASRTKRIVHVDYRSSDIHATYAPEHEVVGDIATNLSALTEALDASRARPNAEHAAPYHQALLRAIDARPSTDANPRLLHPLQFIRDLREAIDDETTVVCDVGSIYMWMARYFLAYRPHGLLFSNGQQTLGVALPWAAANKLCEPERRVVSMSGDGGFLFSVMELETAVREKLDFVHFVWRDGTYDMVAEQEIMKYGRPSGVAFGDVDLVSLAKAFGASGFALEDPADFPRLMKDAFACKGPVLVDIPIDYSDNRALFEVVCTDLGN